MFHPLQAMLWLSGILGMIGLLPIARFVLYYLIGQGHGHLQSLILGAAFVIAAGLALFAGLVADLVAQNRQLMQKMIPQLKDIPDLFESSEKRSNRNSF